MIKKLHERDLIGSQIVDYDEIVDIKRLRQERLAKLQSALAKKNMGGIILFDPVNVRYATGVRCNEILAMRFKIEAFAVIPREGTPIVLRGGRYTAPVTEGFVDWREMSVFEWWLTGEPVSNTHLTLPTILLV